MAMLSLALVALLTASATVEGHVGGRDLGSKGKKKCGPEFFKPKEGSTYCGKFKVNSVPVKIKLNFQNTTSTNIFGSVYGFDMYCLDSPFAMCSDGTIDLDPKKEAEQNCLRKQFEGVDEHMSSLKVKYRAGSNKVQLISSSMKNVYLKEDDEKCSGDDYKFTIMKEDGSTVTMRRLMKEDGTIII